MCVALASVATLVHCNTSDKAPAPLAEPFPVGLEDAKSSAQSPFHCAPSLPIASFELKHPNATLVSTPGKVAQVTLGRSAMKIAFVADARGDASAARAVRRHLNKESVALVISLGGMAQTRDDIHSILSIISKDAPWITLAAPGDQESVENHRDALGALTTSGHPIVDLLTLRRFDIDASIRVGVLPGVPSARQHVLGPQGCIYDKSDVLSLVSELESSPLKQTLWLSHQAPRQSGPKGSDLSDGIHAGDRLMEKIFNDAPMIHFVHGHFSASATKKSKATRFTSTGIMESAPSAEGPGVDFLLLEPQGSTFKFQHIRVQSDSAKSR